MSTFVPAAGVVCLELPSNRFSPPFVDTNTYEPNRAWLRTDHAPTISAAAAAQYTSARQLAARVTAPHASSSANENTNVGTARIAAPKHAPAPSQLPASRRALASSSASKSKSPAVTCG